MSGPDGGRGDGPGSRGPDGPSQRSKTYKVLKTRKGFHTKLIEKVDKQVIENKVISKATVPYVRSKTITFKSYGLLPNTQVYPFFDRKKVSAYVTPAAGFSTSGASLVKGDALITNSNGEVQGTFEIPDPKVKGNPKFETGQVPFRLTSSPTNKQKPYPVTASETLYQASGILRTTQATIRATRNAKVIRRHVVESTKVSSPLVSGGKNDNRPATAADLNETSLEAAVITIAGWKDERGLLIAARPRRLIVPPNGMFVATRILQSEGRVATADNDINAIRANGTIPEGYAVNHYLTDTDSWYLTTDIPNGMKHFERTSMETSMDGDFDTGNVRYKARERYSFGVSDPLGMYASPGA